ncbi:MAG: hypothetical protein AAB288_14825, partial [Acidobacteriota bacterium]
KMQMGSLRVAARSHQTQQYSLPHLLVFSNRDFAAMGIKSFEGTMIYDNSPAIAAFPTCEFHTSITERICVPLSAAISIP